MDPLDRGVDAERESDVAEREQRAVVAQRRVLRQQRREALEDRADTIELVPWAEIHRMRIRPLSVAAQRKSRSLARSRTAAGTSNGTAYTLRTHRAPRTLAPSTSRTHRAPRTLAASTSRTHRAPRTLAPSTSRTHRAPRTLAPRHPRCSVLIDA